MKSELDKRHISRIIIVQRLFERYFKQEDITKQVENEFTNKGLLEAIEDEEIKLTYDTQLADNLFKGVVQNIEKCDYVIEKLASEWPITQINIVDLQILRIAIFEGFIGKITPPKVAIDEAVEIAKEFGGKISGNFVNGVLGTLLKQEDKFKKAFDK